MSLFNFSDTYTQLSNKLYTNLLPVPVKQPTLVLCNKELIADLGLDVDDLENYLSGNRVQEGSKPYSQAYAGHQFGQFNVLGDGRAVILGEHLAPNGKRFDIQLKGSGITPYSRNGDGRATLYSMLREYIISYGMEKLGIPTTKSLAVISTGEDVYREKIDLGGILTRVASSHIRVGTFQYTAMQGDMDLLKTFTDYVIDRHYPEIKVKTNPYISLLEVVMDKQIDLIINWSRVGFIHGVMNTDNVTISGETIDYGPCAFMDIYNPKTVFSSIDRNGRYSYQNQKNIGQWNIARFAECLIPLIGTDTEKSLEQVNVIIESYQNIFLKKWLNMMASKIGISKVGEIEKELILELLNWMEVKAVDFTNTFRALSKSNFLELIPGADSDLKLWFNRYNEINHSIELIKKSNPNVIPRNHLVEDALIEASENSNYEPIYRLMEVLKNPYSDNISKFYTDPPKTVDPTYKTYCGT
jgi:uncharacterized protein YdiU (UPF0061 family)